MPCRSLLSIFTSKILHRQSTKQASILKFTMVGSKDLEPSRTPFYPNTYFHNQFIAKPQWPPKTTSLSGQTAIVTGSNVGLGYEASLQLLELKLTNLILAVRSTAKGEKAASEMRRLYPKANIEVWTLDLCSYDSVQAFTNKANNQLARIDIVILNAGLARLEYNKVESTGHEQIFQVNYLSTILLTILLVPILKAKRPPGENPARLTISSAALTLTCKFEHKHKTPLFAALDDPANFHRGNSYIVSKLLAHIFLWNLVDYVSADDVIINLADPAFVRGTAFARDLNNHKAFGFAFYILSIIAGARSPKVGASCYIDAVFSKGKESHGCFLMSWKMHPFPGYLYTPEAKPVIQKVWDETLAEFEFANARGIIESMRTS